MERNNENNKINEFAKELSVIIGLEVGANHIHKASRGRYYYTQAPDPGAPLLLNHYRGPFFVDMHPEDYRKIDEGEITAHFYIYSANWHVGYFWGGGSMITGGYYQPFDIVNRQEEIRRYFRILLCRTNYRSSGHIADKEECERCPIGECPFSEYKKGKWENEMQEYDPRIDLFNALRRRFETLFPGYTLGFFLCDENVEEGTILLSPLPRYREEDPYKFRVVASEKLIKSLLMRKVTPENWDEYAKGFEFQLDKNGNNKLTEENIQDMFASFDYAAKNKQNDTERENDVMELLKKEKEQDSIISKIFRFLKSN